MSYGVSVAIAVYFTATILMLVISVAYDARRRGLSWAWVLLPVAFGPPGAMGYFILRPPYTGE